MTYPETLRYLFESLPMYQRIGASAYKADLDNAWKLDSYFGSPHKEYRTIHVAGTNGKGSVSHMLAALLQEQGYRVGLYTSPHLTDFRERIRINGEPVTKHYVCEFVGAHRAEFDSVKPSFFEMTVFMAFCYFAAEKVDMAIIEVGLGGRLDTTNIITPLLSVITNIGMDHTQFLGNSLAEIAGEKAGIMKKGIPVIIGRTQETVQHVFETKAREMHCPLTYADQLYRPEYSLQNTDSSISRHFTRTSDQKQLVITTDLQGSFQDENVSTALAVIDELRKQDIRIGEEALHQGMARVQEITGLCGRWQILGYQPTIICDVAHNADGIEAVSEQLAQTAFRNLHMVLGLVSDKNPEDLIRLLPSQAFYYLCEAAIERAMKIDRLEAVFNRAGYRYTSGKTVAEAAKKALDAAGPDDLVFVGGSTYVVADFLAWKKSGNFF